MLFRFKKIALISGALLFRMTAVTAQTSPAEKFSLKDCVQYALQHHPNSTIYKNDALISEAKIKESKSAFLPDVSGTGSLDYNIKLQTTILPPGTFGPTETKLQFGNKISTGGYIEADQHVFDKSKLLDIRSAKVNKEISDLNLFQENETLIYNAAIAYYDVLSYSEKGKLLRENQSQYRQLLDINKLRYEQGVIKKSEYDRVKVNLNNVEAELAVNDNNYLLSLNKLKNAMGMSPESSIVIDEQVDYQSTVNLPADLNSTFNADNLLASRIDQKNIQLTELDVRQKKAAYLPTFSMYGKYGVNAYGSAFDNAFINWFDYSVVGVKLNVPIFSGFKKSSQLQQSRINEANQRLTAQLNRNSYLLDYQNNNAQLFSSYHSLNKNQNNLKLAQEVVSATAVEYKEGTTTLSTFLNDDYSYKEAQSNYITSLIDYLHSRLSFEKSRGTLITYLTNLK